MMRCLMLCMGLAWLLVMPIAAVAAPMNFTVQMSETVVVDTTGGTPSLPLTVGDKSRAAAYSGGSGTNALTFSYEPQAGDYDADGIVVTSPIVLNNGTIKDSAGNNAVLTFTPPTTSGVKVDYPALKMDFAGNSYSMNGTSYNSFTSFLSAAGGTFSRNSVGTYFDASGVLRTASVDTARFDHDPVTLAAKGILIEEGRTNSIRNSAMSGAGTGVWPTNWSASGNNSLTSAVVGTGVQNGMAYVDVRVSGTSSGSVGAYYNIYNNGGSAATISAVNGSTWTHSTYISLIAGSVANLTSLTLNAAYFSNSGYINELFTPLNIMGTVTSTPTRFARTGTANNASTMGVVPYYQVNAAAGTVVDFTLRFAAPQFERGAFATSFIPTSGTVIAREADGFIFPTGSWYDQSAGTTYVDASYVSGTGSDYALLWRFYSDNSKRWNLSYDMSLGTIRFGVVNGAAQGVSAFNTTPSASVKVAAGVATNNMRVAMDGTLGSAITNLALPPANQLIFSASSISKWLKIFKYYPTRLPDTSLQALTQ